MLNSFLISVIGVFKCGLYSENGQGLLILFALTITFGITNKNCNIYFIIWRKLYILNNSKAFASLYPFITFQKLNVVPKVVHIFTTPSPYIVVSHPKTI